MAKKILEKIAGVAIMNRNIYMQAFVDSYVSRIVKGDFPYHRVARKYKKAVREALIALDRAYLVDE